MAFTEVLSRATYIATLYILGTLQQGPFDHFIGGEGRYGLDTRVAYSDGIESVDNDWWWEGPWKDPATAVAPSLADIARILGNSTEKIIEDLCSKLDIGGGGPLDVPIAPNSPWTRTSFNIYGKNAPHLPVLCALKQSSPKYLAFLSRPMLYSAHHMYYPKCFEGVYDGSATMVSAYMRDCATFVQPDYSEFSAHLAELSSYAEQALYDRGILDLPKKFIEFSIYSLQRLLIFNHYSGIGASVDTVASTAFNYKGDYSQVPTSVRYDIRVSGYKRNTSDVKYTHTTVLNPAPNHFTNIIGGVGGQKARMVYRVTNREDGRSVTVWHRMKTHETVAVLEGAGGVRIANKVCTNTLDNATLAWRSKHYIAHPLLPSAVAYVSPMRTTFLQIDFTRLCKAFAYADKVDGDETLRDIVRNFLNTAFLCSDASSYIGSWVELGKRIVQDSMGLPLYDPNSYEYHNIRKSNDDYDVEFAQQQQNSAAAAAAVVESEKEEKHLSTTTEDYYYYEEERTTTDKEEERTTTDSSNEEVTAADDMMSKDEAIATLTKEEVIDHATAKRAYNSLVYILRGLFARHEKGEDGVSDEIGRIQDVMRKSYKKLQQQMKEDEQHEIE